MPKNKFYAVRAGKKPGIYNTWDECNAQVTGVKGAKYKSFDSYEDAVKFLDGEIDYNYKNKSNTESHNFHDNQSDNNILNSSKNSTNKKYTNNQPNNTISKSDSKCNKNKTNNNSSAAKPTLTPTEDVYCFVDGSYNAATKVYGCGGFLMAHGEKYIIQDCGNDEESAKHRNVSGEVLGAIRAVEKAIELNLKEITIYHDYNGICGWANGWKTNIPLTQNYKEFIERARKHIKISFVQVPGHVGIEGNEEADRLAKEAVGLIS